MLPFFCAVFLILNGGIQAHVLECLHIEEKENEIIHPPTSHIYTHTQKHLYPLQHISFLCRKKKTLHLLAIIFFYIFTYIFNTSFFNSSFLRTVKSC